MDLVRLHLGTSRRILTEDAALGAPEQLVLRRIVSQELPIRRSLPRLGETPVRPGSDREQLVYRSELRQHRTFLPATHRAATTVRIHADAVVTYDSDLSPPAPPRDRECRRLNRLESRRIP